MRKNISFPNGHTLGCVNRRQLLVARVCRWLTDNEVGDRRPERRRWCIRVGDMSDRIRRGLPVDASCRAK